MVTQADNDTGVDVQRTVCRTDSGHPRQALQACPYCRAFYCSDCIKTHSCLKDLSDLIQAKWPGYTVTYQWNSDDGLHVSIAKSHMDRILTVIEAEVLEDWSPKQILSRLETA